MQHITLPRSEDFDGIVRSWFTHQLVWVQRGDSPFFWWGDVGDVLLYHKDSLQWFSDRVRYKAALFANPSPPLNGGKNSPWIYWPRDYETCNRYHALKPLDYSQRRFNCAFIGGYENAIQRGARYPDYWKPCCDVFEVAKSRKAPATRLTQGEYFRLMRQSRYGLCLPGYGGKCQREIECFALGVVPIFTKGVNMDYFDKLRPGEHYLYAESLEEVLDLVNTVAPEQWQEMALAGINWYRRNVSPAGSFATTKRIIESLLPSS